MPPPGFRQVTAAYAVFFSVLLTALLPWGCSSDNKRLKAGDPAPAFSLAQLADNRMISFPADFRGKVVAIRFWASWCPYCDQEMRDLEPVFQKYRDQGLVILALNVHQDRDSAARFVNRLKISYDVLLDLQGETAAGYQVIGLPTTYIVDQNGLINTKIAGESSAEQFERIISSLLARQTTVTQPTQ